MPLIITKPLEVKMPLITTDCLEAKMPLITYNLSVFSVLLSWHCAEWCGNRLTDSMVV